MIFLKEILIKLNYYIFKLQQKFVTHINIAFEKTYKKQLKSPNWQYFLISIYNIKKKLKKKQVIY